nr:hypothetical protein [Tanacetum cinerariifolium]
IAAALEDKLDIRMNRFEKSLIEMKNSIVTSTAPLKAVTEVCITCVSNHSYNQCSLTRGGNDYPVFHDNIQQFQTVAVGLDNCLALADLGASINLMPLSIWKKLRLPTLNDTKMVLELANRTISTPTGVAENVFVKVENMLKRREDTKLALNWEKSHFMVKEGIVLGHKISKKGIEVDKAKIEVISKLPYPTTAFRTLKDKLTEAPILIAPNWDQPFKLMCDASNFTEFDLKVIDTRGAENYAADHLLRLKNPYENVFDPKEINKTFPLESLNKVAHKDPSTPWYADLANYHAGNFIIKVDPPGAIMELATQQRKFLIQVSTGLPFIKMLLSS